MKRISALALTGAVLIAACGGSATEPAGEPVEAVEAVEDDGALRLAGQGVQIIGSCRIEPDAQCPGAKLMGAKLAWAPLSNANLSGADLRGVNLERANLWDANLEGANLEGANLRYATLWGANLEGANLTGTRFCGTLMPDGTYNDDDC